MFCFAVHCQLVLLQMPRQGFQKCKCANFILGFPYFVYFLALVYSGSNHIILFTFYPWNLAVTATFQSPSHKRDAENLSIPLQICVSMTTRQVEHQSQWNCDKEWAFIEFCKIQTPPTLVFQKAPSWGTSSGPTFAILSSCSTFSHALSLEGVYLIVLVHSFLSMKGILSSRAFWSHVSRTTQFRIHASHFLAPLNS